MPATRFCLIRHGETAWNAVKRIQGQIDVPLNATGLRQAQAMAEALADEPFAAVYTSSLTRARQTAEPASQRLKLPLRISHELRERHYGIFQDHTAAEAAARYPDAFARHAARDVDYDYEDGESLAAFAARVEAGLRAIARTHQDAQVLVVTHGGVLDIVYRLATGRPLSTPRDFPVVNAALNWVDWSDAGWRIELWADTEHLACFDGRDEAV